MADDINWDALAEMDPIVDLMRGAKIPMTAANYRDLAGEDPPFEDASHAEEATGPRNATPGQVPNTADQMQRSPVGGYFGEYRRDRQDI